MFNEHDNAIRYKWDPETGTGYRLRFEAISETPWCHNRYHVEDWTNHVMTNEWDCRSLDEALRVLRGLFDIDVAQEQHRLAAWLPESVQ